MKSLKQIANENEQCRVDESLVSAGSAIVRVIVSMKMAFESANIILSIAEEVKLGIYQSKEYTKAVNKLNELLMPYRDDLMNTQWGRKLFDVEGCITKLSIKTKGCDMIYDELTDDIKYVLSEEDFKKYNIIINPIIKSEDRKIKKDLGL